ncbi:MAG: hypothetical protein K0R50_3887 [Eubacterium sp.]|nr:hypothetical protein [Eubacterium sp.]
MIKLDVKDYLKVLEPLKTLEINTLFAQSVIRGQVSGTVYVDNAQEPGTFFIVHPYGMSLLFGDLNNGEFTAGLQQYLLNSGKERDKAEWLQSYPCEWSEKIEKLAGSFIVESSNMENAASDNTAKIIKHTRVNFQFDKERYEAIKQQMKNPTCNIVKTSAEMFEKISGAVIPRFFWTDGNDFEKNGAGYSLLCNEEIASTAFSAFLLDGKLEIGIETSDKYRGRGFAVSVCSALIDYCLINGLEPVWSCRLENTASYQLAQKLGFVPTIEIPYYQLPV